MAEGIRFHLDENISLVIASGLRQRGIDVTTTREAELLGASDLEQLSFAKLENRSIFTQDADFLRIAAVTEDHAGIVYVRKGTRSNRQILEALELIHNVLNPEDMLGHVEYI